METDPPFLGAVAEQPLGSRGRRVSGTGCYPEMVQMELISPSCPWSLGVSIVPQHMTVLQGTEHV